MNSFHSHQKTAAAAFKELRTYCDTLKNDQPKRLETYESRSIAFEPQPAMEVGLGDQQLLIFQQQIKYFNEQIQQRVDSVEA